MTKEEARALIKESMRKNFSIIIKYAGEDYVQGYVENADRIETAGEEDVFSLYVPGEGLRKNLLLDKVVDIKPIGCILPDVESIKIYVDDTRSVPEGYILARSVSEAITLMDEAYNCYKEVAEISLDHDLGDYRLFGGDGINVINYMIKTKTFIPINIHSANTAGRLDMIGKVEMLNRLAKECGEDFYIDTKTLL